MRAFVIDELGQPGQVRELEVPQPAQGEVLVRVHAAGVNPMDAFVASGGAKAFRETRTPLVPGLEASGTVESVGSGVAGISVGDEVIAYVGGKDYYGDGTFAELVVVAADAVASKPAGMTFAAAASLPLTGLTALQAADELDVSDGTKVVVVGASGGVGGWFTQIAHSRGAYVVGLARPDNAGYCRAQGADLVIDHTASDAADRVRAALPDGYDVLADFSGNEDLLAALSEQLSEGGRLVSTGARIDAEAYATRGIKVVPYVMNRADRLPELTRLVAEGKIKPPMVKTVPLAEAGDAINEVSQRHTTGKVVVDLDA